MKEQRVSIDISGLTVDQLRTLQAYANFTGDTETANIIKDRIDYILHRMNEESEKEYFKKFVKD